MSGVSNVDGRSDGSGAKTVSKHGIIYTHCWCCFILCDEDADIADTGSVLCILEDHVVLQSL